MDVRSMEHVSNQDNLFIGKGRRKRAIARISLLPKPSESSESPYSCQINGQPLQSYFGNDPFSLLTVEGPLKLLAEQEHPFLDVEVKVRGGGLSSQAEAIRLGLSKALVAMQPPLRHLLREQGFLTSDARRKERKKYGLKKARKASQFSKR
uniref:Small ribosomal subunit protein uS9c n=1 Tax=Chloropicon roscoffensis TaxID=1461544 RepID=A0A4D6C2L2_9CHLO|nr:ribosomal protein S9 [Chloropicon roscoffensis]QBX98016.1 ribosomal protein S9 [Chloropicon roscoffensis]QBX98087.1 ribosomal protein S9 [Chloropicon roscoffensis]